MARNSIRRKELKMFNELEEKKQDLESQFEKDKFNLITEYIVDYITIYNNSNKTTKDKKIFKKLLFLFLEWMEKEYEYEKYYYCRDYNYCLECMIGECCSIDAEDEEGHYLPFSDKIFVDNFIKFVEEEEGK